MLAPDQGGTVTVANIAIYLALIVFIVVRRMIGRPVWPAKQQFILPVVIVAIGWGTRPRQSLLLSLGLSLLGEAAIIWYRSGGASQLSSDRAGDSSQLPG
jgi:hypothetical protein